MRGRTHAVIGAGLSAPFAATVIHGFPIDAVGMVAAGTLAALSPDSDSPTSIVGRWVHIPLPHRGPTHWIAPTGVCAGLIAGFIDHFFDSTMHAVTFAVLVAAAWASHTIADATNLQPVAVLPGVRVRIPYPFGAREGGLLSTIEEAVVTGLVGLLVLHVITGWPR